MVCGVTPDSKDQAQVQRHCCPQKSSPSKASTGCLRDRHCSSCMNVSISSLLHVLGLHGTYQHCLLTYCGQGYVAVLPCKVSWPWGSAPAARGQPCNNGSEEEDARQTYRLETSPLLCLRHGHTVIPGRKAYLLWALPPTWAA